MFRHLTGENVASTKRICARRLELFGKDRDDEKTLKISRPPTVTDPRATRKLTR
jgi:hypothetical protein